MRPSLVVERARRAWTFLNKKNKKQNKTKNQVGTRHKNVESTRQSQGKKGVGTIVPRRPAKGDFSLMCRAFESEAVNQNPEFAFCRLFPRVVNLIRLQWLDDTRDDDCQRERKEEKITYVRRDERPRESIVPQT